MQLFGRRVSKWWLLLLPPLLLLASPLLMMGLFLGNDVAGAVFGPPAIWNRPWHDVPRSDIVGGYSESKRQPQAAVSFSAARLVLKSDGSITVSNLPYDFAADSCTLSGKGTWRGPDQDQKVDLNLISDDSPGSCKSGGYSFLQVAGRSKPYSLYWTIDDPDSGTGIWFKKE